MDFGISFLPVAFTRVKSAADYFKDALALCEIADEAGLKTVKMTEHYLHAYGGYCPSPLAFLAAVASRTKNIRLMTGCILPAFHHPIQIAAETAMLDALSYGRMDIGFARAYLPYEFSAFGIDMNSSRERYTATIDAVTQLWTKPNISLSTPYFSFENATNFPEVVQKPHPPIWCAAVMSRQSFAWAGEQGHSLLVSPPPDSLDKLKENIHVYRDAYAESQHSAKKKPYVAISLPLYIAESEHLATRESQLYIKHYLEVWADAAQSWAQTSSQDYPGYNNLGSFLKAHASDEKINHSPLFFVGTPEIIREKIPAIKNTLAVDQILWQIDFGAQPFATSERTLRLFLEEVQPFLL